MALPGLAKGTDLLLKNNNHTRTHVAKRLNIPVMRPTQSSHGPLNSEGHDLVPRMWAAPDNARGTCVWHRQRVPHV